MDNKDYYNILGVDKGASKGDIKKAFRKLAHQHHPDKKGGDEAKFKEVNEAYTVLSDDQKRAQYDQFGSGFAGGAGAGQGGFGGFDPSQYQDFDIGDIFGDFFGGGGGRRSSRQRRGRDISMDMLISFKDSVYGIEKDVSLSKTSSCKDCKGSGADSAGDMKTCSNCKGEGRIHQTRQSFLGAIQTVNECDTCHGAGKIPEKKCSTCDGEGVTKGQTDLHIKIPAGIREGEMIRLSGAGEAIPHAKTGDLYIKIRIDRHKEFSREGDDLVYNLEVKLSDALLGAKKEIVALDDKKITLKIPVGLPVGEVLRIKGKGVPADGRRTGDLMIRTHIQIPKKLTKNVRKQIEKFQKEGDI